MEEVTFKLSSVLKFDKAGTPGNETYELILKAPSYNERKFARKLKQRLTEAMMCVTRQAKTETTVETTVDKEDDKEEEMDGKSMLFMLQSVPENVLDWSEFAEWFLNSCAAVVSVDEGIGLTSLLVSKMTIDDADALVGTYLANFTYPSLMSGNGSS